MAQESRKGSAGLVLRYWLGVSLGCSQRMVVAGTVGWGLAARQLSLALFMWSQGLSVWSLCVG